MSEDPISAREFNSAMAGIREAMRDGFDNIAASMSKMEKDISNFDKFRMEQSEKNGEHKAKIERTEHELSGTRKALSGEIIALREGHTNTYRLALASLGSIIVVLAGWLYERLSK